MIKALSAVMVISVAAAGFAEERSFCKSVSVKNLPAYELAYVEYKGDYENNPEIYDEVLAPLLKWAIPNNLWNFPEKTKLIIIYPNSENTPSIEKKMWMAITVPKDTTTPTGIKRMEIKGGLHAVGDFEIASSEFGRAWGLMYQRLAEEGYTPGNGYPFEIKKNDSDEHKERKHLVEICIPVEKIKR